MTFNHRNNSLANFCLTREFPNLPKYFGLKVPTVEVIADLHHVSPMTLKTLLTVRDVKEVAIISDTVSDPEPGKRLSYGGCMAVVDPTGTKVVKEGTDTICGSCGTSLTSLHNLTNVIGLSLEQAVEVCATTPARIANLNEVGDIQTGKKADFLCLDKNLQLQMTIIKGKIVYECAVSMMEEVSETTNSAMASYVSLPATRSSRFASAEVDPSSAVL